MKLKTMVFVLLMVFSALEVAAVPFKLHNGTLTSIPLHIPGVMNPNLSPISDSGVDLAVGQKIFFTVKKKKYLLLQVTEDLKGKTLDVSELIDQRKKELGLKR